MSLYGDHWYPCFGLLVTSPLGFKGRVGSLIFMWRMRTWCMFPEIQQRIWFGVIIWILNVITVRKSSWGKHLSFCPQGGGGVVHQHPWADIPQADTPLGRHPPGQTPPPPRGRHQPRKTPPGRHSLPPPPPPEMATAADGTHPTGWNALYFFLFL